MKRAENYPEIILVCKSNFPYISLSFLPAPSGRKQESILLFMRLDSRLRGNDDSGYI